MPTLVPSSSTPALSRKLFDRSAQELGHDSSRFERLLRSMPRKKCFFGCEGKLHYFALPKEIGTRQQWLQFLSSGEKRPHATLHVCSRHFTEDCFTNRTQYDAGFAARLVLIDGSVPSVARRVEESEVQPSTPQHLPITDVKYRDKGCQTDPQPTVSVATQFCHEMKSTATQLSYCTLKPHVRSKGTQVTLCCGTDTTQQDTGFQPSFTPVKGARPAKRPHLEEGGDEEIIYEIPQPHNSTSEPGDSLTESSEISEVESPSDYNDPKYIVFESYLRDFFQTCPVCKQDCELQRQRLGTFVSFNQRCPNCQYTRICQICCWRA
ncbi:uncharacterized protein [Enoplosus armatus]|uniref:uncharacterized protein n=1 Tax=Enoplosus armatus TaxID=215367 RepID=UPI003991B963